MNARKTRFAPSPTGLMHLGNARTALLSALYGQRFLLRIEDTDPERSREEFVRDILSDLTWLGLHWDEGPRSEQAEPDFFQSRRGDIYRQHYDHLQAENRAYPCFCTPQELEIARKIQLNAGQPPRYSGKCARLTANDIAARQAEGREPTLRFRVPKQQTLTFDDQIRGPQKFLTDTIGDFIIRRADGSPAFFFCNAIDDALMGVTDVVRGEDHLTNTPRQILILEALGLAVPRYAHISLILGDDGAPLSKRNGSRSIRQLREEGYFPQAVVNLLARLGHTYDDEACLNIDALRAGFDIHRLSKSPARFDYGHLAHWQSRAIRAVSEEQLWQWLHPECRARVPEPARAAFLDIVRGNCLFPVEADTWATILFTDEWNLSAEALPELQAAGTDFFLALLDAATACGDDFDAFMARIKTTTARKGKALFMPLRLALTGRHDGPDMGQIYRLLTPEHLRGRLAALTSPLE
jgi:glutamyl-tRNA synthetase